MKVYKKLMKVQTELKAPKGQRNNFGKYNYRSCEDILEATTELLKEVECIIILTDEVVTIGDRYYVEATCKFIDCETGGSVENKSLAREEESKKGMDGSQVTGAASSYARKYALNGLLKIDDTKDSDSTNTHGKTDNKNTRNYIPEKVTTQQLIDIAIKKGYSEETLKKQYNVKEVKFIKADDKKAAYINYSKLPDKEVK